MKKFDSTEVLKPALTLFVICLVVTFLLAFTNVFTKDAILNQELKAQESSQRIVLPGAISFLESEQDGIKFYTGFDENNNKIGYVFSNEDKGYGGTIKVMTGITSDGQIQGIAILSHNETPGLGANITSDKFTEQFKVNAPKNGFSIIKGKENKSSEISAITGATISSTAVTNAVNKSIEQFHNLNGKGI